MMKRNQKLHNNKARALIEYAVLIIIIISGLFTFRDYIVRGIQGGYKKMGDSVSFHRQYNAYATISCRCDNAAYCEEDGQTCHQAGPCYDEMCFDGYGCPGFDSACIANAKERCFVDQCQPPPLGLPREGQTN